MHDRGDRRHHRARITRGPHDVFRIRPRSSRVTRVDVGRRAGSRTVFDQIAHHADDLDIGAELIEREVTADEIRPVAIRERAVDDRLARRLEIETKRRAPVAGRERRAERAQVAAADIPVADRDLAVVVGRGRAGERDLVAQRGAGGRQKAGDAGRDDARQLLELRDQPLLQLADAAAIFVPPRADVERHDVVRAEAAIDAGEIAIAA